MTKEYFEKVYNQHAKGKLKICPCCGWKVISFGTTDDHCFFTIECNRCGMAIYKTKAGTAIRNWNTRVLDDPKINEIAETEMEPYFEG